MEWEMMCRVKPDVVQDKETERNLQRIATRGVVQLFNAVQKHQKNVDERVKEAGSSIRKRTKLISTVSKKDFISVLRGMDESTNETTSSKKKPKAKQEHTIEADSVQNIIRRLYLSHVGDYVDILSISNTRVTEVKSEEGPGWTILRDDFMMGASMKDWDKESDGPDDSRPESASDSDT
ncbi:pre-60S ribosomal particles component [Saguinus oedipus]|uniref:RRP15-like protein n=1 Tax=Saguinus oedipus TaxID=9490 RepID=A0ABQ9TP71_SAGOE|nr:pre-60S ribosomal particles component [Saguinus oedipus]